MAAPVFIVYDDGTIALATGGSIQNPTSIDYPYGGISDDHVSASANISGSKLQRNSPWPVNQEGTAADRTRSQFMKGDGSLILFTVWCGTAPTGANSVTVDLQVNGVSVLAAAITLNSRSVAHTEYPGPLSSASFSDGDRISVVINETTGGTPAQDCADIGVRVDIDENYSAS